MSIRILLGSVALVVAGFGAANAQELPHRRRVFPVPILGYTPETSLQIGLAVVGVVSADRTDTLGPAPRPTTGLGVAVYTLKHQYQVGFSLDRWASRDRWHVTGDVGVERFPSQFHGIGAAATDSSETYTPQRLSFSGSVQRRVARRLFVGVGYALRHTRMVETTAGGRLAPGTIPGSRGGTEAIATVDGVWDSRDALYMTRRGGFLRLALGAAGRALGGDHAFRRYTADARGYRSVGHGLVVAAQGVLDATDGTVPFDLLPSLGGQNLLRGYTVPRFRDGTMAAAQGEVRAPLAGIVRLVVFAGAGATAPSLGDLGDSPWRVAGGLGLRLVLDRAEGLQLRFDFAFARGGGGFYVAAGDAF